jgi:hypothetical protein
MKKILLAGFCLLVASLCFAQNQTLPQKLRHLYEPLDKKQIPTGYLWDQSVCFVAPGNYGGQLDTFNANPDVFGMLYGALRNAYVGQSGAGLPAPSVYLNQIKTPPADGSIPIFHVFIISCIRRNP